MEARGANVPCAPGWMKMHSTDSALQEGDNRALDNQNKAHSYSNIWDHWLSRPFFFFLGQILPIQNTKSPLKNCCLLTFGHIYKSVVIAKSNHCWDDLTLNTTECTGPWLFCPALRKKKEKITQRLFLPIQRLCGFDRALL